MKMSGHQSASWIYYEWKFAGIETVDDVTPQFWENRMQQINFEKHITQNGTIILKFFAFE
jgi:polyphosphate kinase 2 (PPK2 family)